MERCNLVSQIHLLSGIFVSGWNWVVSYCKKFCGELLETNYGDKILKRGFLLAVVLQTEMQIEVFSCLDMAGPVYKKLK